MKPSSSISSARVNVSQIDFTVRVLPFEPKVKNVHLCEQQQAAVQKISLPKLKLADISDCSIMQSCAKKGLAEEDANCDANRTYYSIPSDTSPVVPKLRMPAARNKNQIEDSSPVSSEVESIIEGSLVFMKPESENSVLSVLSEEAYERNGRLRTRNWHRNFYPLALRLPENVTSNCCVEYFDMQPDWKPRPKCQAQSEVKKQQIPPVVPLKLSAMNATKKQKVCGFIEPIVPWKQTDDYTIACGYQPAEGTQNRLVRTVQRKLKKKRNLNLKTRKISCVKKAVKQPTEVLTNVTALNRLEALNLVEAKKQIRDGFASAAWILLVSLLLYTFFYRSQLESSCICP